MPFIEFYNTKKQEFIDNNLFTSIIGGNEPIQWPKGGGVYTIWKTGSQNNNELIYIGMTGKFSRPIDGILTFNGGSFRSRANRWTPYRFCENNLDNNTGMIYHFRYGPTEHNVNEQYIIRYLEDAYSHSIPYTNLEIHCFHIGSDHEYYSPVLLESELLTKFLKINGDLPPANNSL